MQKISSWGKTNVEWGCIGGIYLQSARPPWPDEDIEIQENLLAKEETCTVLYTNADGLSNKQNDLKLILKSYSKKRLLQKLKVKSKWAT